VYVRAIRLRLVKVVDRSAVVPDSRLPLRVAPARGEAIDSWRESNRSSHGPSTPCFRPRAEPSHRYAASPDQMALVRPARRHRGSDGGVSSVVEALTLTVYYGTALRLDPNSHRLDATFPSTTPSEKSPPRTVPTNLAEVGYELFTSTEILGKMAVEKKLARLSTRRYPVGLDPVGAQVAEKSSATSQSAVSRRFVAMTETALAELLLQVLSGLDLVALMIDGIEGPCARPWSTCSITR
jgi:hypothetical protein